MNDRALLEHLLREVTPAATEPDPGIADFRRAEAAVKLVGEKLAEGGAGAAPPTVTRARVERAAGCTNMLSLWTGSTVGPPDICVLLGDEEALALIGATASALGKPA